jgi:Calpain family cysteine protease
MDVKFRRSDLQLLSEAFGTVAQPQTETSTSLKEAVTSSIGVARNNNEVLSPTSNYSKLVGYDYSSSVAKNLSELLQKQRAPFFSQSPLYVTGDGDSNSVSMNDIKQGQLKDCWMMAPLAELAQNDPEAIKRMIQKNPDGTYTVTFKQKVDLPWGQTMYVDHKETVTADFPGGVDGSGHAGTGDKNFLGQGEIWPLVIEKAYAQWKGGYDQINKNGNAGEFMEALTGHKSSSYTPINFPILGYNFNKLNDDFNSGKNITFLSRDTVSGKYGVVGDHYYAVQRVYTDANGRQMVQLYNPWGKNQPDPIPYDEVLAQFENVNVN